MDWNEEAFQALQATNVRQVAYVPDAGLSGLIAACEAEPSMSCVSPVTEEDGIGLALGAWLGGQRSAIFMQSSGVGNCVNGFSMAQSCRVPLLLIVTMRGEWGEANPWQVPMGKAVPGVFEIMGFTVKRLWPESDARATFEAAATLAFEGLQPVAVLVSQAVIGAKAFKSGAVE